MKIKKRAVIIGMALVTLMSVNSWAASKYTDVTESHWAYPSIEAMANKGYMVGSISGEYKPDSPIDKFETSRILAAAAGYKSANASAAEQALYNSAYERYMNLINNYRSSFTKWNPNTDREIAYLLDRQIYIEQDLGQFVIKNGDKENLRALSRQEAAPFLAKLAGRQAEAANYQYIAAFADDSKIALANKPYVYYLRSVGVFSAADNFNPNNAVTKAEFAVMLDKTLKLQPLANSPNTASDLTEGTPVNPDTLVVGTVSGSIEKVHSSLNAVQIKYDTGEVKIHRFDVSGNIFVDGYIKTIHDLAEGMPVIGIIKNNVIVDLKAQSVLIPSASEPDKDAPKPQDENTGNENGTENGEKDNDNQDDDDIEYRTLQGTIANIRSSRADTRSVTIEVKIINPSGGVITERETFTVGDDCEIVRGNNEVEFSNIVKNDIVKAKVYSGRAYVLELEEIYRRMNATVVDKKTDSILGTQFFIVEDLNGKSHQLVVDSATELTRKGMGNVKFSDIRIGDTLDLIAEYATITEAYAYGDEGYVEGVISEINVSQSGAYISLIEDDNVTNRYYIVGGALDIYTLKVNSKVRLRLDSKEIEGISVLEEASSDYYTGYIDSISSRYISLKDSLRGSGNKVRVYYDTDTVVTDSATGLPVSLNNLSADMKVYVVFTDSRNNTAQSITILSK